jgi:chromosome segregation ATPase
MSLLNFNKNNMKQLQALAALKGKAAAEITPAELAAVNTELKETGIEGVNVVTAGAVEALETTIAENTTTLAEVTERAETAEAALVTANESVATLEAEVAALKPAETTSASHSNPDPEDEDDETPAEDPDKAEARVAKMQEEVLEKFGF